MENKIDIYSYKDYRIYLRDCFSKMKEKNRRFSYRMFNRLAGLKSSAHLKLIIDGKKNLTEVLAHKICRGFKLNQEETRYFICLAQFNQATLHEEKDRILHQLIYMRRPSPVKMMEKAHYEMYSHWYYVALLECLRLETENKKNSLWISKKIYPVVSLREIKTALSNLKKLGLIEGNEKKGFVFKDKNLSTPDLVHSIAVTNFHVSMCELAAKAVREEKGIDREFSALTIALSDEGLRKAKLEIRNFRKRLHSILESVDEGKKIIAQINLQLFSLSR